MFPVLFQWGSFALPAWHAFYALGAVAAYALLVVLARRHVPEIPETALAQLYAVCYLAGYFGARLLSIVIEEPEVQGLGATLSALGRFGAMTFYGGAVAAFLAGTLYAWRRKLPYASLCDLAIPAGLLALALGRIGCFLNGDDYGNPVPRAGDGSYPFYAVVFPNLGDGTPRYAVQLYEALSVAVVALLLVVLFRRLRTGFRPGAVAYLGITAYANLRLGLEVFRGDFRGFVFGDWLSTSQFISVLVLLACAVTLPLWLRRPAA